jgi:hypothetical protein
VLSDYLVADPRMVRDLHTEGVPHLPVRVRDGTGLVGPLVIPWVVYSGAGPQPKPVLTCPNDIMLMTRDNRGAVAHGVTRSRTHGCLNCRFARHGHTSDDAARAAMRV